jgi:hypothetical protein
VKKLAAAHNLLQQCEPVIGTAYSYSVRALYLQGIDAKGGA